MPGPRTANDFSFISNDWLNLQFDIPRAWNERGAEGLGEYGVFILWSYPINFIFGMLSYLGLNFQIWERVLVFLFILLGSVSIWRFLDVYSLSKESKFVGSLFYLVNTYPILLIDGGQISIVLAYGLFPFAFLYIREAAHSTLRKKIIAGFVVSLLGFFDIRFIFILFLLLLLQVIFDKNNFRKWIKAGLIIGSVVLALNFYWLLANIKVPIEKDVLSSFTKISTNFLNIGHPILVISPHWYKNIFGKISQLRWEFILLPLLTFIAPILRKDKQVLFWLVTAAFSIFLVKGGSPPLPQIYPWLHAHVAGFSFFRDSTKFFFLVTLSFAVLISITSEELIKRIFKSKRAQVFYLLFISAYLLYLIRPIFLNQMTGTFSIQPAESQFQSLATFLRKDNNFGRVFWIPTTAPLSYSDLNHPIVEAARVFTRIPFEFGVKGSYETFNFLREASYMGEIFDISGISYIAYPYPDIRKENLSSDDIKYYYTFLNQLTNLPWIDKRIAQSKIPLLKTKSHQNKIFITGNSWITFGADEIFKEATTSSKLRLSNNAVIFAESKPEMGLLISKYPEAKIVLNKKTNTDLLASLIPKQKIIFPATQLTINPNSEGWWENDGTDLISWRDFLQSKYGIDNKDFDLGGGWAIAEGNSEFRMQNSEFKTGKILFARVMESSRSAELSFYQNDQLFGKINTKTKNSVIRWFEVGSLPDTADLTIKTKGDINVINALALVNPQELEGYKREADDLGKQITEFKPENVLENNLSVVYQKINQTKYKVTVSNLTRPEIVIFSSTYHPGWQLNGQSPIPVYGFLNGFRVDKDGEYILEFEPQRYVELGFAVSLLSVVSLVFYLIVTRGQRFSR